MFMSQPETKAMTQQVMRTIAICTMLVAALAGCSDIYFDRRRTRSIGRASLDAGV